MARHRNLITGLARSLPLCVYTFCWSQPVAWESSLSLANRYVSEGIDNDPGSSGYAFTEITGSYEDVSFGLWYAQSLDSSNNEINLFGEHRWTWDEVALTTGVSFITLPSTDDHNTWEAYAGIEFEPLPALVLSAHFTYDFRDIEGGFLELGVSYTLSFPPANERLTLTPYFLTGLDFGYVSSPRRLAFNHYQIGLEAAFLLTEAASLFANVNQSFRAENLRELDEGDVTWGEVGFRLLF